MLELPPGSRTRIAARITKRGDGIREDDTTTIVNALKVRDRQIIREWLDIRIDVEPPPRLSIPSADNAFGNAGRFPSAMLSSPMGPPPVPVTEHQDQDHHQHLEPEFLELAFALQEIGADRCALLVSIKQFYV